jgi:hypothetical protein
LPPPATGEGQDGGALSEQPPKEGVRGRSTERATAFRRRAQGYRLSKQRRVLVLRAAVAVLALFALLKLGSEFWRLVADTGVSGAIDLHLRHTQVHRWFAGSPVYAELHNALYPPASYPVLWPLVGWLDFTAARWLWAGTSVVMLSWLAWLIVRESGAETRLERAFVALLLLSMNATGVTIGNGQLIVHCLPVLLIGLLLLRRRRGEWRHDLLAASLILVALVKPNIAAFFFWAVLFWPGRLRPAVLVVVGYLALTLFAAAFQGAGVPALIAGWLRNSASVGARLGYGNLEMWFADVGLPAWGILSSLLVLGMLGVWTYVHRDVDIWLFFGVTAIVARVAVYHMVYDDLLVLLPMVALFRIAKRGEAADGSDVLAGVLLAVLVLVMLAPARLQFPSSPWLPLFAAGHVGVWLVVLLFLLRQARMEQKFARA